MMSYKAPSAEPLPPYQWTLSLFYKVMLKDGGKVNYCKPVMYEGQHVEGMYDVELESKLNTKHALRLFPTTAEEWAEFR